MIPEKIYRVTKIQQIWINLTTWNFKSFKHYQKIIGI
jgi:hypothetical protein